MYNYKIIMKEIRFEWDEHKNSINKRKHGVSFEDAVIVFLDEKAIYIADPEHSVGEERFLLLGAGGEHGILVVCHCYRMEGRQDEIIRIISARKANNLEKKQYREVKR